MRAILWFLGLAALFCAYWFGVAALLRAAPAHLAPPGLKVQALDVTGFPAAFSLYLDTPALPARGWRADWAMIELPSYWPFTASGTMSGQQAFDWRNRSFQVAGEDMPVSLSVSAGLELIRFALGGRNMSLSGPVRAELGTLSLALEQTTPEREHALVLNMEHLSIPAMGQHVDRAEIRALLRHAAPLHLGRRGSLVALDIAETRITSGPSQADVTGSLTRRPDGRWDGTLRVTVTNWQPILAGVQQSGLIPQDRVQLVMMMAQSMSTGAQLTLPFSITESVLSLGPFPLLDLGRF